MFLLPGAGQQDGGHAGSIRVGWIEGQRAPGRPCTVQPTSDAPWPGATGMLTHMVAGAQRVFSAMVQGVPSEATIPHLVTVVSQEAF